jgi:hypothetical protein
MNPINVTNYLAQRGTLTKLAQTPRRQFFTDGSVTPTIAPQQSQSFLTAPAPQYISRGSRPWQSKPGNAAPAVRQPQYFTDGSVAPTQPTTSGSGSQTVQPGQGVTVQTRPAANQPIAIGTGDRTVPSGQDVAVPGVGQPAAAPAADLNDEFRKYHRTAFNPNSTMDQAKMQQMQELYKQHGKLSPSLVYNRQYGNKSPYINKSASAYGGSRAVTTNPRTTTMADVNNFITSGTLQTPGALSQPMIPTARPGVRRSELSSHSQSSKPNSLGEMPNLGAASGVKMTGPGAGFAAGVPVVDQPAAAPAADLNDEFRKYHRTAFNPNSPMDQAKMQQMQELYKQHGKLSPSLVYNKQYGNKSPYIKSASVTAFAALGGDMEKSAVNGLAGLVFKGLGWGSKMLRGSSRTAKGRAATRASEAVQPIDPATLGGFRGLSANRAARAAEDATTAARATAAETARAGAGKLRHGGASILTGARGALRDSKGLQGAINYGVPTVGGAGLLYGSNRLGHGSGYRSGADAGYTLGSDAALSAMPEQASGYVGNLLSAIVGNRPADAASMRGLLDANKNDLLSALYANRKQY